MCTHHKMRVCVCVPLRLQGARASRLKWVLSLRLVALDRGQLPWPVSPAHSFPWPFFPVRGLPWPTFPVDSLPWPASLLHSLPWPASAVHSRRSTRLRSHLQAGLDGLHGLAACLGCQLPLVLYAAAPKLPPRAGSGGSRQLCPVIPLTSPFPPHTVLFCYVGPHIISPLLA